LLGATAETDGLNAAVGIQPVSTTPLLSFFDPVKAVRPSESGRESPFETSSDEADCRMLCPTTVTLLRTFLRTCLLALVIGEGCGGSSTTAPTAPPPQAQVPGASRRASDYTLEILNTMQANSINRDRINWSDFRDQVIQRASGAQTITDLYPAISLALGLLDDHHSFYQAAGGGGLGNPRFPHCAAVTPRTPAVPSDIGYVKVTGFADVTFGADLAFADSIQQQIRNADSARLAGWIVDVRGNGGGNMWPMVAGVGPVLGEGVAGYFVAPSDDPIAWSFRNGMALNGTTEIARTTATYALLAPEPRVAVLTDNQVASSGEAVVVSFRGRPSTRSFGSATWGVSTSNTGFSLSDGAMLVLTTKLMADRNRVNYGMSIPPDETIDGDAEVVQRAIQWLRGQ
jgi:carboxyl-terminal processing protease